VLKQFSSKPGNKTRASVGEAPSSRSYLNVPNILAAATSRHADAIHPGYGFLAENDGFAEICAAHGITFVGPSPESIRAIWSQLPPMFRGRRSAP
jgi:acetyl/propionyl-CoA carboxylase alpha subunit